MRSDRGQGTVEYLAVVLLVALIFAGTATVATGSGRDIAAEVPRQIQRGLCIVRGGDCYRDVAPCDVASSTESKSWSVGVSVFRFGHDRVVVVERRSDGTVAVTQIDTGSGGLQTVRGAEARIEHGRRRLSLGGAVTASAIAKLGDADTWILPDDERTLNAFLGALERKDAVRAPDQDVRRRDLEIAASVSRNEGGAIVGTATLRGSGGVRTDRVSGTTTYFLEAGVEGVLEASKTFAGVRAAASGKAAGTVQLALTVNRDGRWVDLALIANGEISASARMPSGAGPVAEALQIPTSGGRRWVAEAHLDLNEPGNFAAAHAALDRVLAFPPRPAAAGAAVAELARRIDQGAVVDVRAYALDSTHDGFAANTGDGVRAIGGSHESSTENTRLIAARTRGLDGRWRSRSDCLKEARA
jgi:hypothetical protein